MAQPHSVSTDVEKDRLAKMVQHFNQGIEQTIQKIPTNYIKVSKAGDGIFGDVFFCVRADTTTFTESASIHNSGAKPNLAKKLVAIKVVSARTDLNLSRELEIMQAIQTQVQTLPAAQQFFQLIEWDTISPHATWAVTSTLPMCCSMQELTLGIDSVPEETMWLVYTQLHEALDFLHNKCKPPIAHRDLHQGNVLIGFSNPDALGLPELKIIDFGLSSFISGKEAPTFLMGPPRSVDAKRFLFILDNIVHAPGFKQWNRATCNMAVEYSEPEGRTAMSYEFHQALNTQLGKLAETDFSFLQELWQQFGAFATQQVNSMSESTRKQIQDLVLGKTKSQFDEVQEKLERIWQMYGET